MAKVIYKIVIIVVTASLIVSISTQYIKMSFDFNVQETATYNDLFFNTDNFEYNIYGIGSSDIYTDRQIEIEKEACRNIGEPPKSKTKKLYEIKTVDLFPEYLINQRNDLLKKCQFKKVDTLKAFGLSFLFNYPNNITTIKLKQGYINKDLDKEYFSDDILQEMLNKGEGIISAGVYTLFGKTYLTADYIFFQNNNAEKFNYRKDAVVKKCVFEISSSDEASELVEKKYSSQASLLDSYRANPISIMHFILFLIAVLLRRKRYNIGKKRKEIINVKSTHGG